MDGNISEVEGMKMEESIITFVGQLGFPIFVAVYFMTRMEKQMREMNTQTAKLSELVNTMIIFSKGGDKNE